MRIRLQLVSLVVVALLVSTCQSVRAEDVIKIDDLTNVVSVIFTPDTSYLPMGSISNLVVNGETAAFDWNTPNNLTAGITGKFYFDLLEPDHTVSDRLMATWVDGSPSIHFDFASAPDTIDVTGATLWGNAYENGTFQQTTLGAVGPDGTILDVYVRSGPVPEPAFYQLGALLALGGLGMLRMRRRT